MLVLGGLWSVGFVEVEEDHHALKIVMFQVAVKDEWVFVCVIGLLFLLFNLTVLLMMRYFHLCTFLLFSLYFFLSILAISSIQLLEDIDHVIDLYKFDSIINL